MCSSGLNENWQGKPKYSEKACPSASLSTAIPHDLTPGSNSGLRGGKPATNRLSCGTACMYKYAGTVNTTIDYKRILKLLILWLFYFHPTTYFDLSGLSDDFYEIHFLLLKNNLRFKVFRAVKFHIIAF
jgi:hypothetical protein